MGVGKEQRKNSTSRYKAKKALGHARKALIYLTLSYIKIPNSSFLADHCSKSGDDHFRPAVQRHID